ncbi:MAG: hypothetical protein ABIK28_21920 [Planctomycetota bacterium]
MSQPWVRIIKATIQRPLVIWEESVQYLLELIALQVAADLTRDLVTKEIWADISVEIDYEMETFPDMPDPADSLDDAADLMFDIVGESIVRVDFEAYSVFATALEEARWELVF